MTKIARMFRQGDLLFVEINSRNAYLKENKEKIIICSSVTGNKHEVKNGILYGGFEQFSEACVESNGETAIVHNEHKPIILPKGLYRVVRQREVKDYVKD
jgi:hypothetical protein